MVMSKIWSNFCHLVYLQPFCITASNRNRRSSGNQFLFLILLVKILFVAVRALDYQSRSLMIKKPLGGSNVDSAFHPSKVDPMST